MAGETMTRHVCDPRRKGYECDYDVGEICCNSNTYPQAGFLSFDNFWRSAIIVLQTITIDGWNESARLAADASGIVRVCGSLDLSADVAGEAGALVASGAA